MRPRPVPPVSPALELVALFLLLAVIALTALAQRLRIPAPILLVVGGSAIGFLPGIPRVDLEPDLVLLVFLPPLLFHLAYFASLRDLRRDLRPITLSASVLVVLTTGAVAVAAHVAVPALPWGAAFALGAIVSPTDPLAAIAIARRLGAPRRIVTLVEGESLINDGTALVVYGTAVGVALGGDFSVARALLDFVVDVVAGVAIGIVVARLLIPAFQRVRDDVLGVILSIAAGFTAYIPAEELHVSGVIAAVAVGLTLGHRSELVTNPGARLRGYAFWEVLVALLNALLFILVGLQLPDVLSGQDRPPAQLLGLAALAGATVVGVRLLYLALVPQLVRLLDRRPSQVERRVPWQERVVVGWSGLRGGVSLAAALALPPAFPERDLIVFLTLSVIFATLVLQGLTLPAVIRRLGVRDDDAVDREALHARIVANDAALRHLERLERPEDRAEAHAVDALVDRFRRRGERLAELEATDHEGDRLDERFSAHQRLLRDILDLQREEIAVLRSEGQVSSAAMREVERDLDLEHERLGR